MTISMYQASAPRFAGMLRNLDAILAKARAHAAAKKIDPADEFGILLVTGDSTIGAVTVKESGAA